MGSKIAYTHINERKFDIKNLYLEHNQEILPENTCLVREKKKKKRKEKRQTNKLGQFTFLFLFSFNLKILLSLFFVCFNILFTLIKHDLYKNVKFRSIQLKKLKVQTLKHKKFKVVPLE